MILKCLTLKLLIVAIIIKIIINVIIENFPEDVEPKRTKPFSDIGAACHQPAHSYTAFPTYILYLRQKKPKFKKSRFSYHFFLFCFKNPGDIHCQKRLSDINDDGQLLSLKGTVA
jgi:hypothetical protein